jgi:CRP-like cAMP-binding protein
MYSVMTGDYIIRAGEIGREMYLVRSGTLEVIAHGTVVATLSDGAYFGEVAILFAQKRSVVCCIVCLLFVPLCGWLADALWCLCEFGAELPRFEP